LPTRRVNGIVVGFVELFGKQTRVASQLICEHGDYVSTPTNILDLARAEEGRSQRWTTRLVSISFVERLTNSERYSRFTLASHSPEPKDGRG
jgi:hypothetical protein